MRNEMKSKDEFLNSVNMILELSSELPGEFSASQITAVLLGAAACANAKDYIANQQQEYSSQDKFISENSDIYADMLSSYIDQFNVKN